MKHKILTAVVKSTGCLVSLVDNAITQLGKIREGLVGVNLKAYRRKISTTDRGEMGPSF